MQQYSVKLKSLAELMDLELVYAAANYNEILISTPNINRPGLQLTGFYDFFDETRIQLIGKIETTYLMRLSDEERRASIERLLSHKLPAIIVCHDMEPLPELMEMAKKYEVNILKTPISTSYFIAQLMSELSKQLAPRITRHGVLVEVYGEGLLLIGESGVGKSETAIELVKRGHRLIADDAVEIKRISDNALVGAAPEVIRYYVELRGIGVVDVRRLFGVGAVKPSERVDLVINMEPWKEGFMYDRLGLDNQYVSILGVNVPALTVPVKPGRNLAVIIEVAAMNNRQKRMGYNAAAEFTEQINKHFDEQLSQQK